MMTWGGGGGGRWRGVPASPNWLAVQYNNDDGGGGGGAVDEVAGVPASPNWLAVQYNNDGGGGGMRWRGFQLSRLGGCG